jgi:hypothetical protein
MRIAVILKDTHVEFSGNVLVDLLEKGKKLLAPMSGPTVG